MRRLLIATALLPAPALAAPDRPSPVLNTPDARDVLTYARPEIARVTHVDLDLAVDFATRTVRGTAALDIRAASGAREIVLDDKGLVIDRITDAAGHPLPGRSEWRTPTRARP